MGPGRAGGAGAALPLRRARSLLRDRAALRGPSGQPSPSRCRDRGRMARELSACWHRKAAARLAQHPPPGCAAAEPADPSRRPGEFEKRARGGGGRRRGGGAARRTWTTAPRGIGAEPISTMSTGSLSPNACNPPRPPRPANTHPHLVTRAGLARPFRDAGSTGGGYPDTCSVF